MNFDLEDMVASRRAFIQAIITEDSFIWGKLDVVKELFEFRDFFPSLSLYDHLVLSSDQVKGRITVRIEVSHIFTIDLKWRDLNGEFFVSLLSQSLELLKYEVCSSR
jgi:hypothetical protein